MKIFINWLLFAVIIAAFYFGWAYVRITLPAMSGPYVLLFSLSIAFTWVEKLKWGVTKPFNCLGCMTGWLSLIMAYLFHTEFWYFYLFAGLLTGSLFDVLKSRV